MRVALSTPGKFHTFDLARELHARGALAAVFSAYPRFKLRHEGLPATSIKTFPWLMTPYMARPWGRWISRRYMQEWENLIAITFGQWLPRQLPECDIYVGLSGSSLLAGQTQKRRGGHYVCDRGSSHIREQDQILRDEHREWGLPFIGVDPRAIAREEAEYANSDCVTVPSRFAYRSFLNQGFPPSRVRLLPYGVNLSKFHRLGSPSQTSFDVLFVGAMSLQKGIPYLVKAFAALRVPRKRLLFAGTLSLALIDRLKSLKLWPAEAVILGHVKQDDLKQLMSTCHVLVLPSVQDGFGMVMAQAMACGCPVIASEHTGACDLFTDGVEGFIVPIRDPVCLADRLQQLADDPLLRDRMSEAALRRVQSMGGWQRYGDSAMQIYRAVAAS